MSYAHTSQKRTGLVSPVPNEKDEVARNPFRVEGWGIDTVAFALRSDCPLARDALDTAAKRRAVAHHAVPAADLPLTVYKSDSWNADCDYSRVLGYPHMGLVKVECRLAALRERNEAIQWLAPPSALEAGAHDATTLLARLLGLDGFDPEVRVQRVDLTADIRFASAPDGTDFLWACSFLKLPRYNEVPHRTNDSRFLEGVEWKTASNHTHARIYDKGLQRAQRKRSGAAPNGALVRLERQLTFSKAKQPTPGELVASNLRQAFLGAFGRVVDRTAGFAVCGQVAAANAVDDARKQGRISYASARRLQGDLLMGQVQGAASFPSRDLAQRSVRDLRSLGVFFERAMPPTARVELAPVFQEAAKNWPGTKAER